MSSELAGNHRIRVGRRIRSALAMREWTQSRLARELGISDAQVNRWVHGRVMPSIPTLERIAELLDVRLAFFFEDDER
jgi:transcriptional regulator with XRE-family HTH domain